MTLRVTSAREAKLLSLLRRELGLSSGLIRRLKPQNAFYVNGEAAHTDHPVAIGDEILVCLDEAQPETYAPEPGALEILYEDEWLLAADKPGGLLIHPSSARNSGTLANYLLHYYCQTGQSCAVHPVSRLDRDTFGVVLFAKNAHVHAKMCELSRGGQIEKCYRAAVFGAPEASEGVVQAPIARCAGRSLLRCISPEGKPARTEYRLLSSHGGASLLELRPITGRTHQLRLHCAFLGCPILGDGQYANAQSAAFSARYGLVGQLLCAKSLRFVHPMTGLPIEIYSKAEISLDFPDRTIV